MIGLANEASKLTSHVIIMALGEDTLCNRKSARQVRIAGIGCQRDTQCLELCGVPQPVRRFGCFRTQRWCSECCVP